MSGEGDAPHAPPRRRRREPLRAVPASAPVAPSTDPAHGHERGRRHAPLVAVALVSAVAALVLAAARLPAAPDEVAAAPAFDLARTETSAPRVTGVAAASANVGDAPPAALGSIDEVIAAVDGVPSTGGYTDLIRSYFGPLTVEAIVIVQCESGFDPNATGENTNGTRDHGLFQINDVNQHAFETVTGRPWTDVYDPTLNVAFAAWLHDRAGGWGPWRCNRNLEQFDTAPADGAGPTGE